MLQSVLVEKSIRLADGTEIELVSRRRTPEGGAPVLVRVVARRADAVTDFGDARIWSETTRIDLRVAEVANPRPGDRLEIADDIFLIQGEPVRDRERLVWTVDLRPA